MKRTFQIAANNFKQKQINYIWNIIIFVIVMNLTAQATEDYVYFGIYAIDLNYKTNGLDFVDLMMFKLWTLLDQINKSLNYSPSCRVKKWIRKF